MSLTGQEFSADLVVVSDIHIRHPDDERARLLEELCLRVARGQVGHFVLLGDIFDFFLGRHPYFIKRFARIGAALEQVAQSGTAVYYFEGNHEFDLRRIPWHGVNVVEEGNHIIKLDDDTKVLMAHGDLVYSSRQYRAFRRLVKSWLVRAVAGWFPGRFLESFALGNASVSRAADHYRELNHPEILTTVNQWARSHDCDHAIFGHLHYPYFTHRAEIAGRIISCHSWDVPNVLIYRKEQFWRVFPEASLINWTLQPAQDDAGEQDYQDQG